MQISLYKFSKKINSTARPEGDGDIVEVSIKQNVPVANSFDQSADTYLTMPVFFLSTVDGSVNYGVDSYNYVRAWGKYYWINNIEIGLHHALVLYCQIDVLATHREAIIGSTQYVSYGSSGYNAYADDGRNRMLPTATVANMGQRKVWDILSVENPSGTQSPIANLTYLVTLTCDTGTDTFVFNSLEYRTFWTNFFQHAWAENSWSNVYGMALNIIGSIRKTALDKSNFRISDQPMSINGTVIMASASRVEQTCNTRRTITISLDNRLSDYRAGDRWSQYFIYLPYGGLVELDSSIMAASSQLRIVAELDQNTLDIGYQVFGNAFVGEGYGNASINVPYGQLINPDTAAAVYKENGLKKAVIKAGTSAVTNAAAGAAFGGGAGAVAGVAGAAVGLIGDAANVVINSEESGYIESVQRTGTRGGSFGMNFGAMYGSMALVLRYTADALYEPSTVDQIAGRPINRVMQVPASGFYQFPNPIITLDTVSAVIQQMLTLMKGGIYIE